MIGNDDCIARAFGVGACTWVFGIKKWERTKRRVKDSWGSFNCSFKVNNLDINSIFEKDDFIKEGTQKEAIYIINFCKDVTKLAIPKLIKKLP